MLRQILPLLVISLLGGRTAHAVEDSDSTASQTAPDASEQASADEAAAAPAGGEQPAAELGEHLPEPAPGTAAAGEEAATVLPAEAAVTTTPALLPADGAVTTTHALLPADAAATTTAVVAPAEAATPSVAAAVAVGGDRPGKLSLGGSYVLTISDMSRIRVDQGGDGNAAGREGDTYSLSTLVAHRLRFAPMVRMHETLSVQADLQLATGFLGNDTPAARFVEYGPPRGDYAAFGAEARWVDQLKLRKLFLAWRTPIGLVTAGRMASSWGLGILANSGDDDAQDWGSTLLGRDFNYGDVVDRVLFATTPIALAVDAEWAKRFSVAIGAGIVERDERIDRAAGDDAAEGVGALRYAHDGREVGIYVAYRDLDDRFRDTLNVWAVDLFGRGVYRLGDIEVHGVGELAWVTGDTTWGATADHPELEVGQLGYVARAGATYLPLRLGADVELGYASGDVNPEDRYARGFSFDPDYNPSLILFEHLRAAESVAVAANASDPSVVGYPPASARLLPTNGAVTNTLYVRPTVRYRWDELKARVAVMWARSEEAMVDPYVLKTRGAVANFQGGTGGARDLGVEVDVGLDYGYQLDRWVRVDAGLQAGRLWPGDGFANAAGVRHPPINLVFGRLIIHWLPEPRRES